MESLALQYTKVWPKNKHLPLLHVLLQHYELKFKVLHKNRIQWLFLNTENVK